MRSIEFEMADITEIDLIRPLWEELNRHHHARSRHFTDYYAATAFADRKEYFYRKAVDGSIRIDLARDPEVNMLAGYCVSSLSDDTTGEIESIFVAESYRHRQIGTGLVTRALAWMDEAGATRKRVFGWRRK